MRAVKTSLLAFLGFLLGAGLCFLIWTLHPFTRLSGNAFVPLEEVLREADYSLLARAEDTLTYQKRKGETAIYLHLNMEAETLDKSGYVYSTRGQLAYQGDTLYARRRFLERILNLSITKDQKGELQVESASASLSSLNRQKAPLIIHATGGNYTRDEDGLLVRQVYTNALETFQSAYVRGYRIFECDFDKTSDGQLVAVHSWKKQFGGVLSYEEFMASSPMGLTPLDLNGVLDQLAINDDTYLVLDFKVRSWTEEETESFYQQLREQCLLRGGEQMLDRIIPQIYFPEDYDLISSIYDWKAVIYTLYLDKKKPQEEILDFIADKPNLYWVTIPRKLVTAEFSEAIHALGKNVLTFTIDKLESAYKYLNLGVDGFYTNFMSPEGWQALYGNRGNIFPQAAEPDSES